MTQSGNSLCSYAGFILHVHTSAVSKPLRSVNGRGQRSHSWNWYTLQSAEHEEATSATMRINHCHSMHFLMLLLHRLTRLSKAPQVFLLTCSSKSVRVRVACSERSKKKALQKRLCRKCLWQAEILTGIYLNSLPHAERQRYSFRLEPNGS